MQFDLHQAACSRSDATGEAIIVIVNTIPRVQPLAYGPERIGFLASRSGDRSGVLGASSVVEPSSRRSTGADQRC